MALESLCMFDLGLSQVIKANKTILMTRQHQLVLTGEVGVDGSRDFVIREDACLCLLSLHVEDADLSVGAASNKDRLRGPRHGLDAVDAA